MQGLKPLNKFFIRQTAGTDQDFPNPYLLGHHLQIPHMVRVGMSQYQLINLADAAAVQIGNQGTIGIGLGLTGFPGFICSKIHPTAHINQDGFTLGIPKQNTIPLAHIYHGDFIGQRLLGHKK